MCVVHVRRVRACDDTPGAVAAMVTRACARALMREKYRVLVQEVRAREHTLQHNHMQKRKLQEQKEAEEAERVCVCGCVCVCVCMC